MSKKNNVRPLSPEAMDLSPEAMANIIDWKAAEHALVFLIRKDGNVSQHFTNLDLSDVALLAQILNAISIGAIQMRLSDDLTKEELDEMSGVYPNNNDDDDDGNDGEGQVEH